MVKFFDETDGIGATNDYTFNSLVHVVAYFKGSTNFFINDFVASVVRAPFSNNTRIFMRHARRRAVCGVPRIFCFRGDSYNILIHIKNRLNKKDTLTVIKQIFYSAYGALPINNNPVTQWVKLQL